MPCLSELITPAMIYNWTHFGEAHCPHPLLSLGPMPSCKSWCKLYGCCLLKGDMCACRVLPCKPSILTHILGILASLPSLFAHCMLLFPDQWAPQAAVRCSRLCHGTLAEGQHTAPARQCILPPALPTAHLWESTLDTAQTTLHQAQATRQLPRLVWPGPRHIRPPRGKAGRHRRALGSSWGVGSSTSAT